MPLTEQQIRRAVYSIVDNEAIGEIRGFKRERIVDEILRIEINDRNSIHGRILESTWLTRMKSLSISTLRARLLCLKGFRILRFLSADSEDAISLVNVLQADFSDIDFDFHNTQFMLHRLY